MERNIKTSPHYGIVIRANALKEKNIDYQKVLDAFDRDAPLDRNGEIISYGPHFGLDTAEVLGKRLTSIGLEYMDDYFYFYGDFPEWADFFVNLAKNHTT